MTSIQEKLIELLIEIDDICKENNIKYILTEETAMNAINTGEFEANTYMAEIVMAADDYKSFSKIIKQKDIKNREIESWENNPKLEGFFARYVNSNTMLWDIRRGGNKKAKGIAVNIRIAVSSQKKNIIEKTFFVIAANNRKETLRAILKYKNKKKNTLNKMILRAILCNKIFSKSIFKHMMNKGSAGEKLYYTKEDGAKRTLEREWIHNSESISFEGHAFKVAGNKKAFVEMLIKNNAKNPIKDEYGVDRKEVIFDMNLPYAPYVRQVKKQKTLTRKKIFEIYDYWMNYDEVVRPKKLKVDKTWATVQRTITRFKLRDELTDRKKEIIELYNRKEFNQLEKMLSSHLEAIKQFDEFGLGVCFDREIFDICFELLEREGNKELAIRAKKNIPEPHKKNLTEELIEKGIIC